MSLSPDARAAEPFDGDMRRLDHYSRHPEILFAVVETSSTPMLLTDPRLPDNPIVFANQAFVEMTGYSRDEVMGRNCRFLQGPATDRAVVTTLRNAIAARAEVSVQLLNYRKDAQPFWTALFCAPVFDEDGELTYFLSTQVDVTASHVL
jgi:PAS domain S-box-containing protein